jgi:hypothetical protein
VRRGRASRMMITMSEITTIQWNASLLMVHLRPELPEEGPSLG